MGEGEGGRERKRERVCVSMKGWELPFLFSWVVVCEIRQYKNLVGLLRVFLLSS